MGAEVNRVCVYAGSSPGALPDYRNAAVALAHELVERGSEVVFGGGNVGLMGVLADAALEAGGRVIGVIPRALLQMEVAHEGLSERHVVGSMHERKQMMADLSDAFVALPGGYGTLDETFEMLTWAQLGFHTKPCGLLNVAGYYDGLLAFLDHCVEQRFIGERHRALVCSAHEAGPLLEQLEAFRAPARGLGKWMDRGSGTGSGSA